MNWSRPDRHMLQPHCEINGKISRPTKMLLCIFLCQRKSCEETMSAMCGSARTSCQSRDRRCSLKLKAQESFDLVIFDRDASSPEDGLFFQKKKERRKGEEKRAKEMET